MSRDKVFTALAQSFSEYDTYFGLIRIRYADFQRIRALAALADVAKSKFTEVDALYCFDNQTIWFDSIPWASIETEKEQWQQGIKNELKDGYWVEVPEDEVDEEKGESADTTTERIIVYSSELGFTFYEKHGEREHHAPWLPLKTVAKFFGEEFR